MKKYKVFIILVIILMCGKVKALEGTINPEWEKYKNLSLEEKSNYNVVPSQYIYEFESKKLKESLYNINNNNINLNSYNYSNDGTVPSKYSNIDVELPSKFNLASYNGKNYVNTSTKNQESSGLCVAFSTFGSVESNLLYKGIENEDYIISKCDDTDSRYCRIKNDLENNEKYKDGKVDVNATFSEKNVDYISSKITNSSFVGGGIKILNTIKEKYNPYSYGKSINGAFNIDDLIYMFSYGIIPKRSLGVWEQFDTGISERTLNEVFDSQDYIVTDYYKYTAKPSNTVDIKEWSDTLKSSIIKYGAREISLYHGPSSNYAGSCYYYDSVNGMPLVDDDDNCGVSGSTGHAMQIIGWNDDYEYSYCKLAKTTSSDYTQETCESAGYKWKSGKGAWILKNSWGPTNNLYVYLSYNSKPYSISGARKVEMVDFDNSYNEKVSLIDSLKNVNSNTLVYKYYKSNKKEILSRVNIVFGSGINNYTVSISNDGMNYTTLVNGTLDYAGLYSFKIDDYTLDRESFYVKITNDGNYTILKTMPTVLTKNDSDNGEISIKSYMKDSYINKNIITSFEVRSKTFNLNSGTKLEYKIYDEKNNDVTSNFVIENNYVVTNNNVANISFKNDISNGKYFLKTYYGDVIDYLVFNIVDKDVIKIFVKEPLIATDGNVSIDSEVLIHDNTNYTWSVSDSDIATISDGVLHMKMGGKVTVILTLNTPDGDTSSSVDLFIYDEKITTPDEFIKILNNSTKSYYIMNDLDFTGVNYDNFNSGNLMFYGILDGGFHTIRNVKRYNSSIFGTALIPRLYGEVRNLIIEDSVFKGSTIVGGITADLNKGKIKNVLVRNTTIEGSSIAGGIAGSGTGGSISNCAFEGDVKAIASGKYNSAKAGGIIGDANSVVINACYNKGSVYSNTSDSSNSYAAGIANGIYAPITNSYNVGTVLAKSSSSDSSIKMGGIDTITDSRIKNSYYLENSNYNVTNDGAKTNKEMLDKSTYENWDFDNIWYMSGTYPVLRTFPVDATDIKLDLFSNIINTNSEYEYDLIIEPYGNKEQVVIENLTPELITIKNNKIVTGKNEGKAQMKLSIGDKSFIKEYNLVDLIKYSYNKEFTNKDIDIKFDIKYYQNDLSNGYLELIYNDNVIKVDTNTKNVDVKVSNNETINYKLKICIDTCKEIYGEVIEITNIDKERPIIKSSYKNKELLINITDEISGIKPSEFLYGISDSDVNVPKEMKEFNNNKIISNITMNYKIKYLWIKNIYDEAGNGLCDSEYCVYDLDIKRNKYSVSYYDEDRKTLIKKEEYLEDEKIEVIEYEKEDSNYYYELSSWVGYQQDLVITKDIELYAKYNKTSKQIKSDKYKVENNYIKNVMLSNIYNKYSYNDFISNISQKEGFLMYENNNIISPEYIKTGMIYKNKYKEYKIVLTGDVTGDGLVKMNDIMMIANHLIDNNTLKGEYFYAADLTNDDKVKMNDLMKLANIMINGGNV